MKDEGEYEVSKTLSNKQLEIQEAMIMNHYFRLAKHYLLITGAVVFILSSAGCVANSALLDTTVNDPVMLDLADWNDDLTGVEDGGGSSGSSMSCYS